MANKMDSKTVKKTVDEGEYFKVTYTTYQAEEVSIKSDDDSRLINISGGFGIKRVKLSDLKCIGPCQLDDIEAIRKEWIYEVVSVDPLTNEIWLGGNPDIYERPKHFSQYTDYEEAIKGSCTGKTVHDFSISLPYSTLIGIEPW